MEPRHDAVLRMIEVIEGVKSPDARFVSVVTVVGSVLRRVLSAEKTAHQAVISLAQQTQLEQMRRQLSNMIETLGDLLPKQVSVAKVEAKEEPSWWYALSEATHILEESIDQLSILVKQQEKGSPIRDVIAQTQRLLRDHYNILFEQARSYLDG
ncbi:MAG: hypothetical protein ACPG3U_07505 [Rhodothermales bacterium]